LAKSTGDRVLHADTLNALGLLHWNCGRLSKARDCFVNALQLFALGGDPSRRGQVANNLGILHEELGQLPQAQRYYERAFRVFERTGIRRHRAFSLGNLANLHRHAARYERARAAYEEVDSELRTMGEAHAAAYTVGNLGDLARDFGDLQTARTLYDATLQFAGRSGDEELRAECLTRIAHVHLLEGRHDLATRHIRSAMRSAKIAKSREFALCAGLLAIESELDRKPARSLLKELEAIAGDATQVGLRYYQLWTLYMFARIEMRLGMKTSAQARVAAGMVDAHHSGYRWWELRFAVEGTEASYAKSFRARCIRRATELRDDIIAGIGDPEVRARFVELPIIRALSTNENSPAWHVDAGPEDI
jgi:tetratricopeptide (TPR) repeat protein